MTDTKLVQGASMRSPYHRIIFTNSIGLRAGDNDFQIIFSVEHGAGDNVFLEEAAVAMTPKTAKLLLLMLGKSLEQIEKQFGQIEMPAAAANMKLEEMVRGS